MGQGLGTEDGSELVALVEAEQGAPRVDYQALVDSAYSAAVFDGSSVADYVATHGIDGSVQSRLEAALYRLRTPGSDDLDAAVGAYVTALQTPAVQAPLEQVAETPLTLEYSVLGYDWFELGDDAAYVKGVLVSEGQDDRKEAETLLKEARGERRVAYAKDVLKLASRLVIGLSVGLAIGYAGLKAIGEEDHFSLEGVSSAYEAAKTQLETSLSSPTQ